MKFSFINPSSSAEGPLLVNAAWPPLGILYCVEYLRREGIETSVLDQAAKGYSRQQALNWIRKENPDILGFSMLIGSARETLNIAREAKAHNPDMKIVLANYHATFNAERILKKYSFVDFVVRGEGEHTGLELAKCLKKNGDLKKVEGITFRDKKGKVVSTTDRPLIKNVDEIPFPDRKLLDVEYSSIIFGLKVATKRFTTMVSSRGCPFQCSFCGCRKFARGVWRPRSVENIMQELELLYSEGYRQFLFVDDNFALNTRRVEKLCEQIKKAKLDIEWFCDSRVDNSRLEVFKRMTNAGCRLLYFGIESGTQRILDYFKKGTTPGQSKKAVEKARKAGIDVIVGSFVIGTPDENRKEIQQTLEFALELDIDVPQLNILAAFPGTDVWSEMVAKGYINEDEYWETGIYVPLVSPQATPFEEIRAMIYNYFKVFYLRPKVLMAEALRTATSPYRLAGVFENLIHVNTIMDEIRQGVKDNSQLFLKKE